jgi:hypothetical protein
MKKKIPNPATLNLTKDEQDFVQGAKTESENLTSATPKRSKARPRNISVYDDFWEEMEQFLTEFPNEGNRSSLIVRVVSDYMIKRRVELRNLKS